MSDNSGKAWKPAERRFFIGGSDARIIMGSDEATLVRLWREKRGEAEPEDLSGNLIVQLGRATEDLNRSWYERNTGRQVRDVQRQVRHSAIPWMAATLDGIVEGTEAVFEAKFMLPWSFSEEAAAIQGELLPARRQDLSRGCSPASMQPITTPINGHDKGPCSNGRHDLQGSDQKPLSKSMRAPLERCLKSRAIAQCFLRLSNLDPILLDRVGRYEARLWRQAAQTIWTLDAMRRPQPTPTRRSFRNPVARFSWDAER